MFKMTFVALLIINNKTKMKKKFIPIYCFDLLSQKLRAIRTLLLMKETFTQHQISID